MTLRLTQQADIPAEYLALFNSIAENLRGPFTRCIDELGRGHEQDIDWWVSELAGRNTYTNPLFTECCYAVFVDRLLRDGVEPEEIVVDSSALYTVLRRVLKGHPSVRLVLRRNARETARQLLKPLYNIVRTKLEFFRQRRAARATAPTAAFPQEPITLVDTFIFPTSFAGGRYNDRYYDGFAGALTPEEQRLVYYAPTFIDITDYTAVMKALRNAPERFAMKEDVLMVGDYVFALLYPVRMLAKRPGRVQLSGLDITPLVRSVWRTYLGSYSSMDALLKYRFAFRLKQRGVRVRLVLDWFENQVIDKGWNAGFNRWYPDTPSVGYQIGIDHLFYLCYYPTCRERDSGVLPKQLALSGRAFRDGVREFCSSLAVTTAPAFRYSHLWASRERYPEEGVFTVLLALPITLEDGNDILRLAAGALALGMPKDVRFVVKQHPSWSAQKVRDVYGAPWPDAFSFVEGSFQSCVERADVVVGSNSSALLETVVKGIPVVITASRSGLTHNPIPAAMPRELWSLCFTAEELREALLACRERSPEERRWVEELGKAEREKYFEPVTRESIRQFLHVPVA